MDINKLWAAMRALPFGPEPIAIEVEDGEINLFTLSCLNENGEDGLYISGRGKTLEDAVDAFEIELDKQTQELD